MGVIHYFTFGDVNTANHNVWVSGTETFDSPERDVEYISIDGRNGDLIQDNGRFHNIEITYPCFIARTFLNNFDDFRSAMHLQRGYQKLWDSYHPLEYREACLSAPINPKTAVLNRSGTFDITFNCKPQRFLIDGSEYVTYYPVSYGGFDSSGADSTDEYCYRIEYIEVTEGDSFTVSAEYASTSIHSVVLTVAFYDSEKTFLSLVASASGTSQSVSTTVPSDAYYARVMYPSFLSTSKLTLSVVNGGVETLYTDGGILLINPTGYTAQPIISAYDCTGYEVRRLGSAYSTTDDITTVTVSDYSATERSDCVVDSVIGDCYSEELSGVSASVVSLNNYVTITEDGDYSDMPTLGAGGNVIFTADNESGSTSTDSFTSCKIKCGWWYV